MPQNACTEEFWSDRTRTNRMRVVVISLRRTPERWKAFLKHNQKSLGNCDLQRVDGVDGNELIESKIKSNLIDPSALKNWSAGAIGAGLSHLLCWRMCFNSRSPLVVLEDDVILANDWHLKLKRLINPGTKMVLMGWNLDSMLRAEFSKQQEMISLFEPAYPSEKELQAIVNSKEIRRRKRLRYSFGLPGYWIEPVMAHLLNTIKRLEAVPLDLGRGFPPITTSGIDSLLNFHYRRFNAEIIIPPLALALNNQNTSLTEKPSKCVW